ncbi:MAG: hypothetical protein N2690_03930, partial [Rhodocyclaceae bacterium]|nr:hypothetical protein [Rhodocyclaceae bacterium]
MRCQVAVELDAALHALAELIHHFGGSRSLERYLGNGPGRYAGEACQACFLSARVHTLQRRARNFGQAA